MEFNSKPNEEIMIIFVCGDRISVGMLSMQGCGVATHTLTNRQHVRQLKKHFHLCDYKNKDQTSQHGFAKRHVILHQITLLI